MMTQTNNNRRFLLFAGKYDNNRGLNKLTAVTAEEENKNYSSAVNNDNNNFYLEVRNGKITKKQL
jgi:hypothetical protein